MNDEKLIRLIYEDVQKLIKMQGENEKRFGGMDERFDRMDERFDRMDERLDRMDERLDRMDERFDKLDACVRENRDAIREINLRIENEICPAIKCVAEGHLDLSRKLDEALKGESEREMTILRLNFLEGEVGRLKKQMESRI